MRQPRAGFFAEPARARGARPLRPSLSFDTETKTGDKGRAARGERPDPRDFP